VSGSMPRLKPTMHSAVRGRQKVVLRHRLYLYISGKLWISCHHPLINSPNPLQATTCRGFFFEFPDEPVRLRRNRKVGTMPAKA
jgi:hypothetical protein